MNVYQTDAEGYLVGITQAVPDPEIPGGWLIPGGCTIIPPPAAGQSQIAKWDSSVWALVPDLRGQRYWLADGSEHEITERGVPFPLNALNIKPLKTAAQMEAEASTAAKKTIAQIRADIFPVLLDFVAALPGAPVAIKAARDTVNAEKVKVRP